MWIDSFVVTDQEWELLGTHDLCCDPGIDARLVMYMDIDGDHVNLQMRDIPAAIDVSCLTEEQLIKLWDKWEADLKEGREISKTIPRGHVVSARY